MRRLLTKMRGDDHAPPGRPPLRNILAGFAGSALAISILALAAENIPALVLVGSFGASTLLAFGQPDAPFSQPRNLVFGHMQGTLIGVVFLLLFGAHWWSLALAVGAAVAAMMLTCTVHPPAASNPLGVFAAKGSWTFLIFPTVAGALIILTLALAYHNVLRKDRWPKYW